MISKKTAGIFIMLISVFSCQEDPEITASIEGKWIGTRAEFQVKPLGLPIPINRDAPSFETEIEFQPDGTLVIPDDTQTARGTYQLAGNKLTIDIDYSIEDIGLSGTYNIETLNETSLVFYLKKRDTISDPEGGPSISGQIKVTLHFRRG